MKRAIWVLLSVFVPMLSGTGFSAQLEGDILIRNVNVIATQTMAIKPNMDVLIGGERILKIGRKLEAKAKQTVDGRNRYLTPGLIDSHTHLSGVPGMNFQQMQNNGEVVKQAMRQIPRSYLYHGFTTVVDLHSDAEFINQWNAQALRPQAYFCGAAPIVDGYPMSFMPKNIRYRFTPYFLVEDEFISEEGSAHDDIDASAHTPKAVVTRMRERGAVCVKTHYEPGFSGNENLPVPSEKLIQNLVSEAHDQGLKVVLHANSQTAQEFGVRAGVDAFVHGMWHWNGEQQDKLTNTIKALIKRSISNKISLQPTFQVLYGERDLHNPDYLTQAELSKVLPKALIEWYASEDGQSFKTKMSSLPFVKTHLSDKGWEAIDAAAIRRLELHFIEWLEQSGALLFGSDTPSDLTFANPPGLNGRIEMKHWQQAGVTPAQFLSAATINNATFFNLFDDIGSVDEGKRADILLLSANPLHTIDAFDHI
ncbi:MAG: amidohydrolase family protein [Acidiferrobacterales bacterium]|nr:amidohydrolase family protein [Acidiferrobacterales bacterium]